MPTDQPRDWLRDPLPLREDGKCFRDVSLVEQHELLFRFVEQILHDVRDIKAHFAIADRDDEEVAP